jgi:hypothetical protein
MVDYFLHSCSDSYGSKGDKMYPCFKGNHAKLCLGRTTNLVLKRDGDSEWGNSRIGSHITGQVKWRNLQSAIGIAQSV